ncbi:hypothetical protein BVX93_00570, partial [bacterium B13(2017)]
SLIIIAEVKVFSDDQIFPDNNYWNVPVDDLPVHPLSDAYINSIGASTPIRQDFGTEWNGAPMGIPFNIVSGNQPKVPISFVYSTESDPGPYPIPAEPLIEGLPHWTSTEGGDRHILVIDEDNNILYETWDTWPDPDNTRWRAGGGAIFDLNSNALRPDTWTSADAAGLPIYPGLVRYDEATSGEINHAIRFTAVNTQRAYVWPARHFASSITDPNVPPMGQRFRLKADFDISGFQPIIQVIFTAFKKYGIVLADNGSNWYISGAPSPNWDDGMLRGAFDLVTGSDFEAVDISQWLNHPDFDEDSAAVPGFSKTKDVLSEIKDLKNNNSSTEQVKTKIRSYID